MITTDGEFVVCDHKGRCDQKIRNFSWDRLKAEGSGWEINRDGTALCPRHNPQWWNRKRKIGESDE